MPTFKASFFLALIATVASAQNNITSWEATDLSLSHFEELIEEPGSCTEAFRKYYACIEALNHLIPEQAYPVPLTETDHEFFNGAARRKSIGGFTVSLLNMPQFRSQAEVQEFTSELTSVRVAAFEAYYEAAEDKTVLRSELDELYNWILDTYPIEDGYNADVVATAINAYLKHADSPFTRIALLAQESAKARPQSQGGIIIDAGMSFARLSEAGGWRVSEVQPGSPADRAGMQPGDELRSVGDLSADQIHGPRELMGELASRAREAVTFEVRRHGEDLSFTFTPRVGLPRAVHHRVFNRFGKKIGYIQITTFSREDVVSDFYYSLSHLVSQEIEGLVIDLRGNGGGRLDVVKSTLEPLIAPGETIYGWLEREDVENANAGSDEQLPIQNFPAERDIVYDGPISVQIDARTASASELFAAAIRDNGRGVIVGSRSYGKGVAQGLEANWQGIEGVCLRSTGAYYTSPNGWCPQRVGITPDFYAERNPSQGYGEVEPKRMEDAHLFPEEAPESLAPPPVETPTDLLEAMATRGMASKIYVDRLQSDGFALDYALLYAEEIVSTWSEIRE